MMPVPAFLRPPRCRPAVGAAALAAASLFCSTAHAHFCGPSSLVMGVGDIRIYSIIADVEESEPSSYSLTYNGAPAVVAAGPASFSRYSFGPFFLQGLSNGSSDLAFQWSYPPRTASGYCSTHVVVTDKPFLTAANFPYSAYAGDPGNLFTGEATLDESPDLALGGPNALEFRRYYASGLNANLLLQSSLGINWAHNFDTRLAWISNRVDIVTFQGVKLQFQKNGTAWQPLNRQARPFQLLESGANFVLGDRRENKIYTFGNDGSLIFIADTQGNTLTLSYSNNVLTQVSDGLGRALNFHYSGFQQLESVDDGTRSIGFFYDFRAPLLSNVTDAGGGLTTYNYDGSRLTAGLLVSKTRPKGNTPLRQAFDSQGRMITQVQLRSTNVITYSSGSTAVTDSQGHTSTYFHNTDGQLTAYSDAGNNTVNLGYNAGGQRSQLTDRDGHSSGLAFDPVSGKPSAITNADGTVVRFTYSDYSVGGITFYALTQVVYPDGGAEQFIRDSTGKIVTRIDRLGQTWRYTYNARGQVVTIQNPLGGTTALTYNPDATLASISNSELAPTTYSYDSLKRLVQVVHPDGGIVTATHDAMDRVTSVTDPQTNTYAFFFDANGNPTRIVDPNLAEVRMTYDELDRLATRTDRRGYTHSLTYDEAQHVAGITNRNGDSAAFTYDSRGRLARMIDAEGYPWDFTVSNEGEVTGITDPLGRHSSVALGASGRVTGWTNAAGGWSLVVRGAENRVTQYVDELRRTNYFTYDSAGRLTTLTRPRIGSAHFRRNALGLVEEFQDFNGKKWFFGYSSMGTLVSVDDPVTVETSNAGNVQTVNAEALSVVTKRDFNGLVSLAHYSDGTDFSYSYDHLNQVAQVNGVSITRDKEEHIANTASWGINFGATYTPAGQVATATFNNGALTVSYGYNRNGDAVNVKDDLTQAYLKLRYSPARQLVGLERGNGVNSQFDYNEAGWGTRFREGSFTDIQRLLDGTGKTYQKDITGALQPPGSFVLGDSSWAVKPNGRISSPGFFYDPQGWLQSTPSHRFTWNGPRQLEQADTVNYGYNGFGDLTSRTEGSTTTWFAHNYALRQPFVGELDAATRQYMRYYVQTPSGIPAYNINAGDKTVQYYHLEPSGFTHFLTDGGGQVTDTYQYNPSGTILGHSGTSTQPFTWRASLGLRYDFAEKLYFSSKAGQRFYDPDIGRALSPDTRWPNLNSASGYSPYVSAGNFTFQPGFRLPQNPYQSYLPDTHYTLGGQLTAPGIVDFNFNEFRNLNASQDTYRVRLPVDCELAARLDPRLGKYFRPLLADDCGCCYCCCCCDCCCDCCCGPGPAISTRLNLSSLSRGYLYSPLFQSPAARNFSRAEAFEKFFLQTLRSVVGVVAPAPRPRMQLFPGIRNPNPGRMFFDNLAEPPVPSRSLRNDFDLFRPSLVNRF